MSSFRVNAFNLLHQREEQLRIGFHNILMILDVRGRKLRDLQISDCFSVKVASEKTIEFKSEAPTPVQLQYKFDSSEDMLAFVECFRSRKMMEGVIMCLRLEKPLFIKYNFKNSKLSKKHFWLSNDDSEICWSSNRTTKKPSKVLLSEIQDIIYGPSTKNFLRALKKYEKADISYACCFSIVTAKKTIDFQANSDKEIWQWLQGLYYLLAKRKTNCPSLFTPNYFCFRRFRLKLTQAADVMGLSFPKYLKMKINKFVYAQNPQPQLQSCSTNRDTSQLSVNKHKRNSTITRHSYLFEDPSMNSPKLNSYQILTDRIHPRANADTISNSVMVSQQGISSYSSNSMGRGPFPLVKSVDEKNKMLLDADQSQSEVTKAYITKGFSSYREGNLQKTAKPSRQGSTASSNPLVYYMNNHIRPAKDTVHRNSSVTQLSIAENHNQSLAYPKQQNLSLLHSNDPHCGRSVLNISNISPINQNLEHGHHVYNQSMFEPAQKIDFTYCLNELSKVEERSKVQNDSVIIKQDGNSNDQESGLVIGSQQSNRTNISQDILEETEEYVHTSADKENINSLNIPKVRASKDLDTKRDTISSDEKAGGNSKSKSSQIPPRQKPKIAKLNFERILKERTPNSMDSESSMQVTSKERSGALKELNEGKYFPNKITKEKIPVASGPKTLRESMKIPVAQVSIQNTAKIIGYNSERGARNKSMQSANNLHSNQTSQNSQRYRRIKLTLDKFKLDESYRNRSEYPAGINHSNSVGNSTFIGNQSFAAENNNTSITGKKVQKALNSLTVNRSGKKEINKQDISINHEKSIRSNNSGEKKIEEQWTSRFRGEETTPAKISHNLNANKGQEASSQNKNSSYRKKKNLVLDTSLINIEAAGMINDLANQNQIDSSLTRSSVEITECRQRTSILSRKTQSSLKKSSEDDNTSNGTVIRHEDVEKDGFSSASEVWKEIRALQENLKSLQESNNAKDELIKKLRSEKSDCEKEKNSAKNELNTTVHSLNVLRDYSNSLKDQLRDYRSRNETLEKKLENLEYQLNKAYIHEKSLPSNEKLDELHESLKKLTKENSALHEKLQDEHVSKRINEEEKKFYIKKLSQLEKGRGKHQLEIFGMQKELQDLRSRCDLTKREALEQFQSVKEIVPDLFNIFNYQTDRIYSLEAKVSSLTAQNLSYEKHMKQRYSNQ